MYVVSNQSFSREKTEYRSAETEKTEKTGEPERVCVSSFENAQKPYVSDAGGRIAALAYGERLAAQAHAESFSNAKLSALAVRERGSDKTGGIPRFRRHIHAAERLGTAAEKGTERRSLMPASMLTMSAAFAAGFVTGCMIWSGGEVHAQCARLAKDCFGYMRSGNDFAGYLTSGMRCLLPFTAVLALSALFAGGFLICPAIMLVRGAGTALLLCSLMPERGAFIPTAVFAAMGTAALIVTAADAARVSITALGSGGRREYLRFSARLALYAAALLICSAVYAVMMVMLNR